MTTFFERARRYVDDYRLVLDPTRSLGPLLRVCGLMLVAGSLDLVGVGLIAPFIAIVAGQNVGALPRMLDAAARYLPLGRLGAVIVVVFIAKAVIGYYLQEQIVEFSESHRARLMTRLLESYLSRSYEKHLSVPGADLINTLFWHTAAYSGGTLAGSLRVVTDSLVLVAVGGLLFAMSPAATLTLAAFLGGTAVVVSTWVRRELTASASEVAVAQSLALAAVQNSLGAFREIRVLGTADAFRAALDQATLRLTRAGARQHALHYIPRGAIEAALVSFLVGLCVVALRPGGESGLLLPVLGAMGVAALRLLPLTTSLLSSFGNLRASRVALTALARELRAGAPEPVAAEATREPFRKLELRGVSFRYPGGAGDSLSDIDLVLKRGEVLGIAGRSGAGKSTLVDVLLGLLRPRTGRILVDGADSQLDHRFWHAQCAYIPQDVFLISGSLRDNITFGHRAPEPEQLTRALKLARLDDLVASGRGLDVPLGERGLSLSGGQRQRVAIARALFHDRSVLVMDEATSALDAETEADIRSAITDLRGERTIIVVAHRESMLAMCDRVVHLAAGRVDRIVARNQPDA